MSELNDTDSFNDLNDDEDIFQDDPFEFGNSGRTTDNQSNHVTSPHGIIDKMKNWWNTRSLTQSRLDKLNDRGIPLYDLDSNGNPRLHTEGSDDDPENGFEPVPYPSQFLSSNSRWHFNSTKREKFNLLFKLLKWLIILGLIIALILHVVAEIIRASKSGNNKLNDLSHIFQKGKSKFNPNKLYNNGSMEFYPITLVINLRYISPSMISKDKTPFLYNMIYPHINELDEMEDKDKLISVLQPNFPFESIVQDWCMMSGQYPIHNGIMNSDINGMTIDNVTLPIWDNLNKSYNGNFNMKSYGWGHVNDDKTNIHDLNHKDSHAKIQDIFNNIDYKNYTMRPELILLSLNDLQDCIIKRDDCEDSIMVMDKLIRKLYYEFRHRNLLNFTNIIILSDSGIDLGESIIIKLEDLLSNDDDRSGYKKHYKMINKIDLHEGRMISLKIDNISDRNIIFKRLKDRINPDEISLYIRDKLPLQYHFELSKYGNKNQNNKIDNIWLIPRDGYNIIDSKSNVKGLSHQESIFIGHGPYFQDLIVNKLGGHYILNKINNIVIYDIISSIVGLNGKNKNKDRDGYDIEIVERLRDYVETTVANIATYTTSMLSSTLSSTLSSVYTSTSSRSTVTTTEVSKITITPTPTTNNNNWNQYFNQDNLHSMIDKLKDTEEGIVDNVSDLINGLLNGGG